MVAKQLKDNEKVQFWCPFDNFWVDIDDFDLYKNNSRINMPEASFEQFRRRFSSLNRIDIRVVDKQVPNRSVD